jgi:hypothetical protein
VQVGNASHRQSWQVCHQHAFITSHCDRQGTDGGWLIDDEQDLAVLLKPPDQSSELGLVIGQGTVQKALACAVQCHGVMRSFADIDTDENLDAIMLLDSSHADPESESEGQRPWQLRLGIHVTGDLGIDPDPAPSSDDQLPAKPGDNTPRIMSDWGQESYRARLADPRISGVGRR